VKRSGILNAHLAEVVAGIGHGQTILLADAGMPRPRNVPIVDLAVTLGLPGFLDVLQVIVGEMMIESYVIAEELVAAPAAIGTLSGIRSLLLGSAEGLISHEELKLRSASATLFVRTGEATPYANVLLSAGVVF
jgi:D-ribose pyranase